MRIEKFGFEDDFNLNPIPVDLNQIENLNLINDMNQKKGEKKNSHRRSFSQ